MDDAPFGTEPYQAWRFGTTDTYSAATIHPGQILPGAGFQFNTGFALIEDRRSIVDGSKFDD
jgi:hypothetical protein